MNKFTKMAVVAAGVALAVQGAQAANFVNNDLYLGFTSSSATSDVIIDLGQASSLFGGPSVINLSTDLGGLSTFNSVFNNTANGVNMAVAGADSTFGATKAYATQLRVGGPGASAAAAGSDLSGGTHTSTALGGAATAMGGMNPNLPTAGNLVGDANKSYSAKVVKTGDANSFIGKTGINPGSVIDASGLIYEDIWSATQTSGAAGAYTYRGYFTFDYNNDALTFTPATLAAVPEPATYGLFAGAGLLALSLRRQFRRKTA